MPILACNAPPAFEEACWALCMQLSALYPQRPRRIVVTSALPGEGKTTVAVNLAVALAQKGARVLLLEANLRSPVLAEHLRLQQEPLNGLAAVLEEKGTDFERGIVVSDLEFDVLLAGVVRRHPMVLLDSPQMAEILHRLAEAYDWVLLDTPAVCRFGDACALGKMTDGTVLVLRQSITPAESVQTACDSLKQMGVRLVGSVLNDCEYAFR
ncbi:MAG: CpsD/CapB family tyrosine-protein kinase [Ethanoligenens sp.]|uniref:tyrosine-protein kinase family protein n=1 Tax=Ethanoligenens sp. TaxID=2099655 RepID=UPI0039EA12E6